MSDNPKLALGAAYLASRQDGEQISAADEVRKQNRILRWLSRVDSSEDDYRKARIEHNVSIASYTNESSRPAPKIIPPPRKTILNKVASKKEVVEAEVRDIEGPANPENSPLPHAPPPGRVKVSQGRLKGKLGFVRRLQGQYAYVKLDGVSEPVRARQADLEYPTGGKPSLRHLKGLPLNFTAV